MFTKLFLFGSVLLSFSFSKTFAQDPFKQAIDDFHYALAFTYHPMADENNFAPIKERSSQLAEKAEALEKALDGLTKKSKEVESAVEQLVEQCKALDEVIKKGASDEVIKTRLSTIHDRFHELEHRYEELINAK